MSLKSPHAEIHAEVLAALSHPNRIRILEYLRNRVSCNCELAPALGLEQSNLSRHLKILLRAGIVQARKEGLKVNYKVVDPRVFQILELAQEIARREAEKKQEVLAGS